MLIKAPLTGTALCVLLLAGAPALANSSPSHAVVMTRDAGHDFETDFTAVDGRPLVPQQNPAFAQPAGQNAEALFLGDPWAAANDAAGGSGLTLGKAYGVTPGDTLPLAKISQGGDGSAPHGPRSVTDFLNQVRYGGLPEPASWALILLGFGLIGGALRGFVLANRRLARLQEGEAEEA